MQTASARLQQKVGLLVPAFATPGRLLLEHPRAPELYPTYLATSSYVALVLVPLMQTALERAEILAPDDPVAAGLAEYLERHILEEIHGEEAGADTLEDLEAVGIDTASLRRRPLPSPIAALIGSQYFWICNEHPVAILGLLELEALHPHAPTVEQLIERTGLPRAGFRQLLVHAELDVVHAEELHDLLDSLPLSESQEQLIALSALQSMAFLIDAWLDVVSADGQADGSFS